MSEHLESLNGLIFENGEKMENGLYLELMNLSRKIYEDFEQMKKQKFKKDDYLVYKLRRITREQKTNGEFYLRFYESNNLLIARECLEVNDYMRIFSEGDSYKFIKIVKINEKSFKYDLFFVKPNGARYVKRGIILKFRDRDYYENLEDKNILFYEMTQHKTYDLFSDKFLYNDQMGNVEDTTLLNLGL
jgi:hypothetical protein